MKALLALLSALAMAAALFLWLHPATPSASSDQAPPAMTEAQAKQRVIDIVNQPVTHLPRTSEASEFSPGWFHPGAEEPDFDHVDIRQTQEFPYSNSSYVTSDVTPNEMFVGSELEFNAMTKYFYTDRSVPKRRLSEAEMEDINRLYRVIGRAEDASRRKTIIALAVAATIIGALLVLLRIR